MDEHRRQSGINWGSIIGWLIFFAVIAGGPLLNTLQNALGGTVRIPAGLLPFIILGLVILGALVSVIRGITRRSEHNSADDRSTSRSQPARSPFPSSYQPSTYDDDRSLPQSVRSPFPSSYQPSTYNDDRSLPQSVRSPFPSSAPDMEWIQTQARRMSLSDQPMLPSTPRFDPVISPLGVAVGIVGLIILVGVGLYIFSLTP
ncbi:MAG: hypothetical protein ACUVSY_03305 [Roseiflexus sp.]